MICSILMKSKLVYLDDRYNKNIVVDTLTGTQEYIRIRRSIDRNMIDLSYHMLQHAMLDSFRFEDGLYEDLTA